MWKNQLLFTALFALGSILAGVGWVAEFRALPVNLTWAMIAGHAMQVIGAFGLLLIPDAEEKVDESLSRISDDERRNTIL